MALNDALNRGQVPTDARRVPGGAEFYPPFHDESSWKMGLVVFVILSAIAGFLYAYTLTLPAYQSAQSLENSKAVSSTVEVLEDAPLSLGPHLSIPSEPMAPGQKQ